MASSPNKFESTVQSWFRPLKRKELEMDLPPSGLHYFDVTGHISRSTQRLLRSDEAEWARLQCAPKYYLETTDKKSASLLIGGVTHQFFDRTALTNVAAVHYIWNKKTGMLLLYCHNQFGRSMYNPRYIAHTLSGKKMGSINVPIAKWRKLTGRGTPELVFYDARERQWAAKSYADVLVMHKKLIRQEQPWWLDYKNSYEVNAYNAQSPLGKTAVETLCPNMTLSASPECSEIKPLWYDQVYNQKNMPDHSFRHTCLIVNNKLTEHAVYSLIVGTLRNLVQAAQPIADLVNAQETTKNVVNMEIKTSAPNYVSIRDSDSSFAHLTFQLQGHDALALLRVKNAQKIERLNEVAEEYVEDNDQYSSLCSTLKIRQNQLLRQKHTRY